jgi:hypothetical protein
MWSSNTPQPLLSHQIDAKFYKGIEMKEPTSKKIKQMM